MNAIIGRTAGCGEKKHKNKGIGGKKTFSNAKKKKYHSIPDNASSKRSRSKTFLEEDKER